jgi:O-succinylbenzoate synthase
MVIKPARTDIEKAVAKVNQHALKMVVTSSIDHPVGVAHALYVATELKKFNPNTLLDCGCLTLRVYKPNEFANTIQVTGPYLAGIKGTGIGFDDLLEKTPWVKVQK